jgi:hypothetical protein
MHPLSLLKWKIVSLRLALSVEEDQKADPGTAFLRSNHQRAGVTVERDALYGVPWVVARGTYSHTNTPHRIYNALDV